MRFQFLSACALLVLCCASALGQTSDDLRAKYGPPVDDAFKVRPGVRMKVTYGVDGRACEMVLESVVTESSGGPSRDLSEELAEDLISELVPVTGRGEKSGSYGFTLWTGQQGQTDFSYENVSIHYLIRKRILFIEWQNRGCKQEVGRIRRRSNNGMHPTADTPAVMFLQRPGAAGDAWR
jgi:hypothetical protein